MNHFICIITPGAKIDSTTLSGYVQRTIQFQAQYSKAPLDITDEPVMFSVASEAKTIKRLNITANDSIKLSVANTGYGNRVLDMNSLQHITDIFAYLKEVNATVDPIVCYV